MKKITSSEKTLYELFKINYNYLNESTYLFIKFYENQYKIYEKLIINHLEEEPLKFFKTKHNKWEEELNTLNDKHDKAFKSFLDECNELYQLHSLSINM